MVVNQMANRNDEKHLHDVTFASVAKEMAEPCATAFVRKASEVPAASTSPFHPGDLLYNRDTKEDGLVTKVYQEDGVTMYEVLVSGKANSLDEGDFVSNWAQDVLEPPAHL